MRLPTGIAELSVRTGGGSSSPFRDERGAMIQCGTALFRLKTALQSSGRMHQLELFPDLDQLSLVARISGEFNSAGVEAYPSTSNGFSENQPAASLARDEVVSTRALDCLVAVGSNRKAWLDLSQSEASRKRLCELATEYVASGADREGNRGLTQAAPAVSARGGALRFALGYLRASSMASLLLGAPRRAPEAAPDGRGESAERPENMVALAVLKTKTDDKYGWVAAGEALARVQLEAEKLNVSWRVFGQAFRTIHARQGLRNIIGRKGFVQAIVGFGWKPAFCQNSLGQEPAPQWDYVGTTSEERTNAR